MARESSDAIDANRFTIAVTRRRFEPPAADCDGPPEPIRFLV
jgi:hypothetical protein